MLCARAPLALLCGEKGLYLLNADTGQASEIPSSSVRRALSACSLCRVTRSGSHFLLWDAMTKGVWWSPPPPGTDTKLARRQRLERYPIRRRRLRRLPGPHRCRDNPRCERRDRRLRAQAILSGPDIRSYLHARKRSARRQRSESSLCCRSTTPGAPCSRLHGDLQGSCSTLTGERLPTAHVDPVPTRSSGPTSTYPPASSGARCPERIPPAGRRLALAVHNDNLPTSTSATSPAWTFRRPGAPAPLPGRSWLMPIVSLSDDGRIGWLPPTTKRGDADLPPADQDSAQLLAEQRSHRPAVTQRRWVALFTAEQTAAGVKTEVKLVPTGQGQESCSVKGSCLFGSGLACLSIYPFADVSGGYHAAYRWAARSRNAAGLRGPLRLLAYRATPAWTCTTRWPGHARVRSTTSWPATSARRLHGRRLCPRQLPAGVTEAPSGAEPPTCRGLAEATPPPYRSSPSHPTPPGRQDRNVLTALDQPALFARSPSGAPW